MLAAIKTTTLSRRSCALTGSAMTSRSRRSSTRGPPSAQRILRSFKVRLGPQPRYGPNLDEVRLRIRPAAPCDRGYSEWGGQGASFPLRLTFHSHYGPLSDIRLSRPHPDRRLGLIQPVQRVQRAYRHIRLISVDQDGEFNFGRGDGENIDLLLGQRLERLGGDAGMAAHADADDRDLGDVGRAIHPLKADRGLGLLDGHPGALAV